MLTLTSTCRIFREQKPIRPSFPSVRPAVRSSKPDRFSRPPEGQRLPFTEYYDGEDETGVWLRHAPPSPCYESLTSNIEIGLMKFEGHEYPPGTVRKWLNVERTVAWTLITFRSRMRAIKVFWNTCRGLPRTSNLTPSRGITPASKTCGRLGMGTRALGSYCRGIFPETNMGKPSPHGRRRYVPPTYMYRYVLWAKS